MLKGIANTESVPYTLKADKENPTVFFIKNISDEAMASIIDRSKGTTGKETIESLNEILLAGLVKIENVGDGAETISPVTKESLKRFKFAEKKEVADAVQSFNILGEIETKN